MHPGCIMVSIIMLTVTGVLKVVKRLPKTRSGKIMRRVLRSVVEQETDKLGDLSTLDDPTAVQEVIRGHERLRGNREQQK